MTADESSTDDLIQAALTGNTGALSDVFEHFRPRLRRMIDLHMDRRVHQQVSSSDVLEETFHDVSQQLAKYSVDPKLPFFLWLRQLTAVRLAKVHHEHLGSDSNHGVWEVALHRSRMPQATSFAMASKLIGRLSSAENEAIRADKQIKLQTILNAMDPGDREVLAMRHFEQLSSFESATILELSEAAAGMKFLRALRCLKQQLKQTPEMLNDSTDAESETAGR